MWSRSTFAATARAAERAVGFLFFLFILFLFTFFCKILFFFLSAFLSWVTVLFPGYANYDEELDDLRSVVAYLRADAGRRVVCVLGHSKGATAVLLYAVRYGDVPLTVNIAGRYDYSRQTGAGWFKEEQLAELRERGQVVLGNGYVIHEEDLRKRLRFDMSVMNTIDPTRVRVLTIHGSADQTIPVEDAYSYGRLLGSEPAHRLVIIEDGGHKFTESVASMDALGNAVRSWLLEHIEWAKTNQLTRT
jgi:pimeloyl-ACP methyl ester carboxylesterase